MFTIIKDFFSLIIYVIRKKNFVIKIKYNFLPWFMQKINSTSISNNFFIFIYSSSYMLEKKRQKFKLASCVFFVPYLK